MSSLSKQSDERLLVMASGGDQAAFGELVRRYRKSLIAYARRILGSQELAEDAVQQSFLQAWCALQRETRVENAKPWLYRIVLRSALRLRQTTGAGAEAELNETVVGLEALHGQLEQRFRLRRALEGIAELPHLQRDALLLTVMGGSSHDQAATELGVSPEAVRGLVHRARTTLRSRAAALAPVPLLAGMIRGVRGGLPFSHRLPQAGLGTGGAGLAGAVSKGGALVATATILVASGAAQHASHHPPVVTANVRSGHRHATERPDGVRTVAFRGDSSANGWAREESLRRPLMMGAAVAAEPRNIRHDAQAAPAPRFTATAAPAPSVGPSRPSAGTPPAAATSSAGAPVATPARAAPSSGSPSGSTSSADTSSSTDTSAGASPTETDSSDTASPSGSGSAGSSSGTGTSSSGAGTGGSGAGTSSSGAATGSSSTGSGTTPTTDEAPTASGAASNATDSASSSVVPGEG